MRRPVAPTSVWLALHRLRVAVPLALLALVIHAHPSAANACGGDCALDDHVTAAELVQLAAIASGITDVAACLTGDADQDGQVAAAEIDQAVHGIFAGCTEPAVAYEAVAGDVYRLSFPMSVVSLTQATAVVAALEENAVTDEAALRTLLSQLLLDVGVDVERIAEIAMYTQRQDEQDVKTA